MKKIKLLLIIVCIALFENKSFGQTLGVNGDITFAFQFNGENVDNLNCMSTGNGMYLITVTNSWALDTVIIVYNGYSQMDTIVNTVGNSSFDVGSAWTNGGMLFSSSIGALGSYMFPHSLNKIMTHGDTLEVGNLQAITPATDPGCTYSSISGDFFIDNNGDCQFNTGDNGIMSSVQYTANYSNGQVSNNESTDVNGQFNDAMFKSDGFIDATFSISSIYNFAYTISSCSQMMYNITALPATGINFSRECAADVDVSVYLAGVLARS